VLVLINSANEIFIRKAMTHPNSIQNLNSNKKVIVEDRFGVKRVEIYVKSGRRLKLLLDYLIKNPELVYRAVIEEKTIVIEAFKNIDIDRLVWLQVDYVIKIKIPDNPFAFPEYEIWIRISKCEWLEEFEETPLYIIKIEGEILARKERIVEVLTQLFNSKIKQIVL